MRKLFLSLKLTDTSELLFDGCAHEGRRLIEKNLKADAAKSPNIPLHHEFSIDFRLVLIDFLEQLWRIVAPTVTVSFELNFEVERSQINMFFLVNHDLSWIKTSVRLPLLVQTV